MTSTERQRGGDVLDPYLTTEPPTASGADDGYLPANWRVDTHPVTPIADETAIWGDKHTPDLLGLASAVQTAQAAVRLQGDEALFEALSAGEIQSAQDYARRLRADQREHAYQARKALLDDEAARREHEQGMTKRERDDEAATQVARYSYKRLTSPTGDLARLNTARLWVPMLALLPAVFAVILGAANVGVELNRISAGTAWINWVVSPIFTVPVFAILVAQLAGFTITAPAPTVPFHRAPFTWLKVGLLAVEVVLNVAPHYLGTGATGTAGALVFGLVPLGLAVSMVAAPKLRAHLTDRFIAASKAAWGQPSTQDGKNPASTPSHLHGKNPHPAAGNDGDEASGEAENGFVPEPERKAADDHRAAFWAAVNSGEIDPAQESVNAIAKKLGTRWATADGFITAWEQATGQTRKQTKK
ncbi:hypothetical protein A8924_1527 [Saccharopolyspora erythraea NRRL 2338]|uniref:Uncharacterized protein n=2 Tax=Saccharopolyspora erythraea TaxID=1836 RepID=A4F8T6_SACEN|nr:hypothetical protein [Saccharopolyspora erythraea]EQD86785.1 hypothetical protein N599_07975 [Saccharopolyspora erythraea D]PFG94256.1 hypothetical protein A8924_1527 [Saccharopolyspora erythraea NRRL 2338]QRK91028.1 hypothetical protein JQX30_06180 [Saccharopolyspora erythraea]CAM00461.1 hypothetical protein SACE_1130 [Saccharopolyspora erythraea NRRL 2338]